MLPGEAVAIEERKGAFGKETEKNEVRMRQNEKGENDYGRNRYRH